MTQRHLNLARTSSFYIFSVSYLLSSLHGFRYITEDGRHWCERVLWVLLCTLGFIFTIYFINPIWSKWKAQVSKTLTTSIQIYKFYNILGEECDINFFYSMAFHYFSCYGVSQLKMIYCLIFKPTLTSLDSTNYPIWEIDFPGVTICSPNKVDETRMDQLAQESP